MTATNGGRDKIVFETNLVQTLALKFASGKEVASQFSDEPQYLYTCTDNRVFFASAALADKIAALDLEAREPFTVLKKEVRSGAGKPYTEWVVERPGQAALTPTPENATSPMPTSKAPANGSTRPQPTKQPIDRAMLACLLAAGRAAHAAEEVLENEGAAVHFSSRDVSALATTLLIHGGREGFFSWLDTDQPVATRMPAATARPAPKWKPAQIACKTRGELKAVFAQLREAVGEVEYEKELTLAGVSDPTHFRDAARAYASYDRLVAMAKETV